ncbi:SDR family NAD(P)-dependent oxidoreductase [Chelatococcus asaccharovorans]|uniref:SDR family NAD(P)-dependent oxidoreductase n=1 Tax=Chelatococcus asaccharovorans TaxID=28210 RepID=UPI00224C7B89|nr:SDR family oxidoreductase [Chelatococcus asaccharovorans]CAH1659481.1 NAD(P)-dependent dehydrogenase (Short-subunit alcohol dehydrogenase family) [Chelatococcus asaccharovorans]CAH1687915.1 NAD(P)-dependent dehydrogenase (Short-subunit alcohol dehydrogenase family) [Chelatococcus asaccharovorans]
MKTVLITGAAQGIGRATAERFLASGHALVATDMSANLLEELKSVAPDRVATLAQDIKADPAPDAAVDLALKTFGRLDVLVNNAGVGEPRPIHESDDSDIDRFLDINVRAQIRFCRAALAAMTSGAAIVNIASIFGFRGNAGAGVYAVSKAAMIGLTRQLAADHGPAGIRVNAVAPGLIRTPLTADRIDNDAAFRRQMVDTTPFPRIGTPQDIAAAVCFLASEDAGFISGHTLVVDGGWLVANGRRDASGAP